MTSKIKPHHQSAIDNLVNEYKDDPRFPALIIGGSVAKGCARDDSDVDFMIVTTDEEFDHLKSKGDLFINRTDLCDFQGGFVDQGNSFVNTRKIQQFYLKNNSYWL